MLQVLFIGDIVGKVGRGTAREYISRYKKDNDIVIANGENAAGGLGLTSKVVEELFSGGIDVITTGNHLWDKKEIIPKLKDYPRILRPANYPPGVPGYGSCLVNSSSNVSVAVINLAGRVFMPTLDCPFQKGLAEVERLREKTPCIILDFHAEATSEKIAMGRFLTGKVSAVIGTHTHVQTADSCILEKHTAYITDVGMTGPIDSIIGMDKEKIMQRFLTQVPYRMEVAKGEGMLQGATIKINEAGKAEEIVPIREKL